MASSQPKTSELVEVLLQQVEGLQKSLDKNNQLQISLSNKIDNTIIKVDVSKLRSAEQDYRKNLQNDFTTFFQETKRNNNELLEIHKNVSSKRLLYLISLNIFLVFCTALSTFIAVKNYTYKSDYEVIKSDNTILKSAFKDVQLFFLDNPKVAKQYKKWKTNSSIQK